MQKIEQTLDSREVAEMVEKDHAMLLRDLRRYEKQFTECKIAVSDFFRESEYKDSTGRTLPCYCITKKGCEFIAHKLTGTKGTEFTACYINRFHEMEDEIKSVPEAGRRKISFLQEIKAAAHVTKGMSQRQKVEFYKEIYRRHGLDFDIAPEIGITDNNGSRCDRYRNEISKTVSSIRSERRLMQISAIASNLYKHEQEKGTLK